MNYPTHTPQSDLHLGDPVSRSITRLVTAVGLIALGVLLLLSQAGIVLLHGNWWAFFIALPAISMLITAYRVYQQDGYLSREAGSQLTGGIIVGGIAIMAFTGQWQLLLPFVLVVVGVAVLASTRAR